MDHVGDDPEVGHPDGHPALPAVQDPRVLGCPPWTRGGRERRGAAARTARTAVMMNVARQPTANPTRPPTSGYSAIPVLFATWKRLMTLPRLAALAVALSVDRMTVARVPTAKPAPILATMRTSMLAANKPTTEPPTSVTRARMLRRRCPTTSARNPAGRSTARRAMP